jgi:hypothetical protein
MMLDELNFILGIKDSKRDYEAKAVKVAILDTGVSESYHISAKEYIKDYRDFVSQNDKIRWDNTGQGTSSIRLLQMVYEDAEIYVGRFFETSEVNDLTQDLMAKVPNSPRTRVPPD